MNVAKRTKKLRALLDIRLGPGAAILSKDVKRIHLDFAKDLKDGHFGPRKFWRKCMPRLKYHNPAISMTVKRTQDQAGPATLTIFFTPPSKASSDSPAPSSLTEASISPSGDRFETIDMKHRHESEILDRLMDLTKGVQYEASPDEKRELQDVIHDKAMSDRNREAQMRLNEVKKQEKMLLEQARGGEAV